MLKVSDFWYQYMIATNHDESGNAIFTVGIVTMDGADLAHSRDFATMTEAAIFRTNAQVAMANGASLADAVCIDAQSLPAEIQAYEAKRMVWYTSRK